MKFEYALYPINDEADCLCMKHEGIWYAVSVTPTSMLPDLFVNKLVPLEVKPAATDEETLAEFRRQLGIEETSDES